MKTYRAKDAAWLHDLRCHRDYPPPAVFVETGTYRGVTARLALEQFVGVHTIERDPTLFAEYSPALQAAGAHCWFGDSAILVPHLAAVLELPVFWFLDAHWVPDIPEVLGTVPTPLPLWEELRAIAARPYPDIVVVDDVHCFEVGPQPDWYQVTEAAIVAMFPYPREVVVSDDQLSVYR